MFISPVAYASIPFIYVRQTCSVCLKTRPLLPLNSIVFSSFMMTFVHLASESVLLIFTLAFITSLVKKKLRSRCTSMVLKPRGAPKQQNLYVNYYDRVRERNDEEAIFDVGVA